MESAKAITEFAAENGKESRTPFKTAIILAIYIVLFWVTLPLFLFVMGMRLDILWPLGINFGGAWKFVGVILIVIGFVLMAATSLLLWYRGKGLPISHLPPARLVTSGANRYLRHPIYVGYTLAFAGVSIIIGSAWSLLYSVSILTIGWICYALFYEEPVLLRRHGENYRFYIDSTGILWPRKWGMRLNLDKLVTPIMRGVNILANKTILFQRENIIFVTYGLLTTVGGLLFMQLVAAILLAQGMSMIHVAIYIAGEAATAILFAKLFWWLGHITSLLKEPLGGIRRVGFVSWGGLAGLALFALAFSRATHIPFLTLTDSLLPGMFIAYAIGRIGCLTYGCCYGTECERYGIVYRNPHSKAIREKGNREVRRHAVQLYSSLQGLALFMILIYIITSGRPIGLATGFGFVVYAIGRAFIEFYRDRKRFVRCIFTIGHAGCLAIFICGWTIIFLISRKTVSILTMPILIAAISPSLVLAPLVLGLGIGIFFIMGFHWRRVGTW